MKKIRIVLIICAFIIGVGQLTVVDYSEMSWSNNAGSYLGIISMTLLIIGMIFSKRFEKRNASNGAMRLHEKLKRNGAKSISELMKNKNV